MIKINNNWQELNENESTTIEGGSIFNVVENFVTSRLVWTVAKVSLENDKKARTIIQ